MHKEEGQVLLIVVLVMVVALTVSLALVSRSITNLHNTGNEANSERAFSAAEAGIEQALKLPSTGNNVISGQVLDLSTNTTIKEVDVTSITDTGNGVLLNDGYPVFQDDGTDVWLSTYSSDPTQLFKDSYSGNMTIYWGDNSGNCSNAALEIVVMSGTRNSPTLTKYAVDPCNTRNNNFQAATSLASTGGKTMTNGDVSETFWYATTFSNSISNGLLIRIIPLYTSASIGVQPTSGSSVLPAQGEVITSIGTAGPVNQQVTRKINFFKGYPAIPSEFFYTLFTPHS